MRNQDSDSYDAIWQKGHAEFVQGRQKVDEYLSNKQYDPRRGVTLVARPSGAVCSRVSEFLDRLEAISPGQHFYLPEELHVTVLSLIPVSPCWRNDIGHLASFRSILRKTLARQPTFRLHFKGVTASPEAMLIQGFQLDDRLQQLRDNLRAAFEADGFGSKVDRRYKRETAHLSAMRFRQPVTNWERLLPQLETARDIDFGETVVESLQLIWGDWYASASTVRVLEHYPLS